MKYILLSLVALAAITGFLVNHKPTPALQMAHNGIPNNVITLFNDWKKEYNMQYAEEINSIKLQVFYENLKTIEEENSRQNSYTLGINQFTATTKEEFVHVYLGTLPPEYLKDIDYDEVEKGYTVPSNAVDWSAQGVVQGPKNQGSCGSCWAFSATASVESFTKQSTGSLPNLSEQQLVDCSKSYGNYGCNGGWPSAALKYVKDHGQASEAAYPYQGRDGTCRSFTAVARINGVGQGNSCAQLSSFLNSRPVSVCVDASNWSAYRSGVFNNCGKSINHAVFAVGYDNNGNWKIKNSWGTSWGQGGYITLAPGDTCGVCEVLAYAA